MIEPISLCYYSSEQVGATKVSELIPFLEIIAVENNLKINRLKDFNEAKLILIKSVMYN